MQTRNSTQSTHSTSSGTMCAQPSRVSHPLYSRPSNANRDETVFGPSKFNSDSTTLQQRSAKTRSGWRLAQVWFLLCLATAAALRAEADVPVDGNGKAEGYGMACNDKVLHNRGPFHNETYENGTMYEGTGDYAGLCRLVRGHGHFAPRQTPPSAISAWVYFGQTVIVTWLGSL